MEAQAIDSVTSLIARVDDASLRAAFVKFWTPEARQIDAHLRVRDHLRTLRATPTTMNVLLGRGDPDDEDGLWIDVSGQETGGEDRFAIEYTPWPVWLGMGVILEDGLQLTPAEKLANILYEMTWAGFDEEKIKDRLDDICGAVETVRREIEEKG